MLQIRSEQMFAFDDAAYAAWVEEMLPEVLACWPRLEDDAALRARLEAAAREASGYGLRTKGEWLRYANCAIALGDALAGPEPRAILDGPHPPSVRLERLADWTLAWLRAR
ncbi:MAG: hypothetical protein KC619_01525 [Myxococcales bacterium]|nr:hypothetical protein [Myxococcales bacterium]